MNGNNIVDLPNELLEQILGQLDTMSRINAKATCQTFAGLTRIDFQDRFVLHETGFKRYFASLFGFLDYIYDDVLSSPLNDKRYYLLRCEQIVIVFTKVRTRNKYTYSVRIEENNQIKMRFFYNSKHRKIVCVKTVVGEHVVVPEMLFLLAMRFLMKIYKFRRFEYNFEKSRIPSHLILMLRQSYRGELVREMIASNFSV